MISAPAGLVARYKHEDVDDRGHPRQRWAHRRVIAFTDDGEPLIVGDATEGEHRKLVRADTYSTYDGIIDRLSQKNAMDCSDPNVVAYELAALRALELAGKRLLNNSNRALRGQFRRVDPWEIHTQVPIADPDRLLDDAYALLHKCLPDQPRVYQVIDSYVRERLATKTAHDRRRLQAMLVDAGILTEDT